jgi:protein MpaA
MRLYQQTQLRRFKSRTKLAALLVCLGVSFVHAEEKNSDTVLASVTEPVMSPTIEEPDLQQASFTTKEDDPIISALEACMRIAGKLASVRHSDCKKEGLENSGGLSVSGLPIIMKEYPPLERRKPKGRVLLLGGIHADELSSISIVFNWMRTLNKYHSGLFHWHVVPLMNPDGLLNGKPQRMNQNGVDLNRNFPTDNWHEESEHYWVHKTKRNPRRYPGPNPLSEPESMWLAQEIARFKPDAIVSIHAPYGILDFDGPRSSAPKRLGHLHLNLLGTYPGSLGNYAGVVQDIPVVTIELPYAGIMPSEQQMSNIWIDLVRWLKKNVDSSRAVVQVESEKLQTDPS